MKLPFFIALFLYCASVFAQSKDLLRFEQKEGPIYRKEREAWIRGMHRAEAGVNTDLLDELTRQEKAQFKMNLLSVHRGMHPLGITKDTLAEGKIIGSWSERGSNNLAGRMHTCDVDWNAQQIYAASSLGNIWKGSFAGNDWVSLNDGWRFGDVHFIRIVPLKAGGKRIIVAANPAAVYYSDNEGKTWQKGKGLDGPAAWGYFRKATISNSGDTIHLLGQEWDYKAWKAVSTLYLSTDQGVTFRNVLQSDAAPDRFDIWRSRSQATPLYVIKGDTIGMLRADGSVSYLSTTPVIPTAGYFTLKGSIIDGVVKLVLFVIKDGNTEIYTSLQDTMWEHTSTYAATPFNWNNSLAVSEIDPHRIYFGAVNSMRSLNGGVNWDTVNQWGEYYDRPEDRLHADIPGFDIIYSPTGLEYIFTSTDGGLYQSTDGLESVLNLTLDHIGTSQYYSTLTSNAVPSQIYTGSQDQGYQTALDDDDGKLPFEQIISGDYGHLTSSDGGGVIWCNYPGFSMIHLPEDGLLAMWTFEPGRSLWLPPIVADPDDPLVAYVASGNGDASALWKLQYLVANNTIEAEELPFDFTGNRTDYISSLAISLLDHDHRYVLTTDGKFFHSSDAGQTWRKSDSTAVPGSHYFYGNSILPSQKNLGELFIAGSGYSNSPVYYSTDHGATFVPADSGLPRTLVYDIAQDDDEQFLFAATEVGPYIYSKEAKRWFDMSAFSAPDHVYWTVEYVPATKTVRFGTYGRGIWDFAIEKVVNAVKGRDIPASLSLAAEYATGNTSVRLSFTNPEATAATLRIYDATGRVIRELCNTDLSAGEHTYRWDFTDRRGAKVSDNMYLAVLAELGKVEFVKIIVR